MTKEEDVADPTQPARASVVDNGMEFVGYAMVVAFSWFVWPPLPLLVGGLVLVLAGNLRAARRDPRRPRLVDRLARAVAAYRSAAG